MSAAFASFGAIAFMASLYSLRAWAQAAGQSYGSAKGLEKLVIVFQAVVQAGGSVMNVTDLKTQMHMQEWSKLIEAREGNPP